MKSIFTAGAFWVLSMAAMMAADNLVINGDISLPEGNSPEADAWVLATPFTGKRMRLEHEGYGLSLEAEADDDNATWLQRNLPLKAGTTYRFTYRAKAEPGQQYRGYVEYWNEAKTNAYPQGAGWRAGNGEWQEWGIDITYKEGMRPPYIALNVKAPGKVVFSGVSIVDLDAAAREGTSQAFALDRWSLDARARMADTPLDGRVIELLSERQEDPAFMTLRGITLAPGQQYRLSYEVKAVPGQAATSTGFQYFRVYAEKKPGNPEESGWQDCFESWQTRSLDFAVGDEGSGSMRFVAELKAPGALLIRNFRLEPVTTAKELPFAVELTHPAYRQMLLPEEQRIAGHVEVKGAEVTELEITLEQEGRVLARQSKRAERAEAPLAFEFAGETLAKGEASLHVRALGAGGELGSNRISLLKVAGRQPSVMVGEDLVLRQDGRPFFPLVLWNAPANHRQLLDLHKAGMNTFVAPLRKGLLDTAARYNMKLVGDLDRPRLVARESDPLLLQELEPKLRETVERYANHPALLAWYIADEPLWTGRALPPLRWTYSLLRKIDPYHPIWINEAPRNTVEELARYATAADLFGVDIYPVPQGGTHSELDDRSLSAVGKYTDRFHETVAHRKPVWMVLQAFAWLNLHDRKADGVYPTWEESRFMAYNALVHGAHGLVWWGSQFINEPEFWDALFRTTREIANISAILVEPTVLNPGLIADHGSIAILHKQHKGDDWFLVINESDQAVKASFQLKPAANRLHVHFEERSLQVQVGKFRDRFRPWDVHVYSTAATLPPPLVKTLEGLPDDGESFQEEARKRKAPMDFESRANWIWGGEEQAGVTTRFRRPLSVKPGLKKAMLWITGDDFYTLYLNGKKVGADRGVGPSPEERGGWVTLEGYNVTESLSGRDHLIAVEVEDAGQPPAGLLFDLRLEYEDGTHETVLSDANWKAMPGDVEGEWMAPSFDDKTWLTAREVAPYGSGPWRKDLQPVLVP